MSKFAVGDVVTCVRDDGYLPVIQIGERYVVAEVYNEVDVICLHGREMFMFSDSRFVLSLPVKQPEVAKPPAEDAALIYLKDGLASFIEADEQEPSDYDLGYRAALEDALLDLYGLEARHRAEFVAVAG